MTVENRERWHGTAGGYGNHHCRCDECRRAWAASRREYYQRHSDAIMDMKRRIAARGLSEDDSRHGTLNGYRNHGCRCDRCRSAAAAYQAARRQRAGNGRVIVGVSVGLPVGRRGH